MIGHRNEARAADWTAWLRAGRSSSFHCFQLFLEENVPEKPQEWTLSQRPDNNTTKNNPCDQLQPRLAESGDAVKHRNRSVCCPHTPSSWRNTNKRSDVQTLARHLITSWKLCACFEGDGSAASQQSCNGAAAGWKSQKQLLTGSLSNRPVT